MRHTVPTERPDPTPFETQAGRPKRSLIPALAFWTLLALSFALEGIFYLSWAQTFAFSFSSTIILTGLALAWVLAHARESGVHPSKRLHVAVVAFALIAVPYYRFRYFGAGSGFRFLAWVLGSLTVVIFSLSALDNLVNSAAGA